MSEKAKSGLAEAVIEDGMIVIRVSIKHLPVAYQAGVAIGCIEPGWKITDAKAFAPEVVLALNDEDERGTTPIHRLFDRAFEEAIEQGAQGVEPEASADGRKEGTP